MWNISPFPPHSVETVDIKHCFELCFTGEISPESTNPENCGGTFHLDQNSPTTVINASNAFIPTISPGYCDWYIYSPTNTYIIMEFEQISLAMNDWLYVFDSQGRFLLRISDDVSNMIFFPIISDAYVHVQFDAYEITSNSYLAAIVSFTGNVYRICNGAHAWWHARSTARPWIVYRRKLLSSSFNHDCFARQFEESNMNMFSFFKRFSCSLQA